MTSTNSVSEAKAKKRKEKIALHLQLLQDLYKALSDGEFKTINYKALLKKNKLNDWTVRAINKLNILEKSDHRNFKWRDLSVKPSLQLATDVYEASLQAMNKQDDLRSLNPKKKENSSQGVAAAETIKIQNIKKFLDAIYPLMEGVSEYIPTLKLNLLEQAQKYNLNRAVIYGMAASDLISVQGKRTHTEYKWVGEKPSIPIAEQVLIHSKNYWKHKKAPIKKYKSRNKEEETETSKIAPMYEKGTSKKHLWKDIAHKAIDMDDPELALKALNKM